VTASPETLHLLAHQAQLRARTEGDWWDNPLNTALAAVGATRHPPAFRRDGEQAVDRLRRWRRDGQARRISADVAALALTAAAAAAFGRRDRELEHHAIEAVEDLSGRTRASAPVLHLALACWALDRIVPDRDERPWPALRNHLAASPPVAAAEGPVASLASALSARVFDGAGLIRTLLSNVPTSPTLEDGAVLLWVLTVAVERCSEELSSADSGLRALTDRRAELGLRLAQELDAEAFSAPEIGDFDPEAEVERAVAVYLSPLEALLLDISLASRDTESPWLRFEEAARLFGRRERDALGRLAGRTAMFCAALGAVAGGLVARVLADADVDAPIAVLAGVIVSAAGMSAAGLVWHRHGHGHTSRAAAAFFLTVTVTAAVELVNQSLHKPFIPGGAGMIAGLLIAAVVAVVVAAASPRRRTD
jgi:hypothetical protein